MTDHRQHPITPPKIMVGQWLTEAADPGLLIPTNLDYLATQAARWGWDQREPEIQKARDEELEAMLAELKELHLPTGYASRLRVAMRPEPPTLREQALNDLDDIPTHDEEGRQVVDLSNIRLALESLPQ
jgi:hypothetical protein